jgi:hypothetical protein
MKHYRIKEIPATTRREETHTTCDICNADTNQYGYDVDECTIKNEQGSRFPEGTNLDVLACDLCGECFRTKLVPWLESQGVAMQRSELSY